MQPRMTPKGSWLFGLALAAAILANTRPALAWRFTLDGSFSFEGAFGAGWDKANGVALDSSGNIIAAGVLGNSTQDCPLSLAGVVVKLDGRLGTASVLWRRDFTTTAPSCGFDTWPAAQPTAVAVDRADNVIAVGIMSDDTHKSGWEVVKLDGATGATLWEQRIYFPNSAEGVADAAYGVALDSGQNVIVLGAALTSTVEMDAVVMKFDGSTGAEVWRAAVPIGYGIGGPDIRGPVAVDAADNVFAAALGWVGKFDGTDGTVLWIHTHPGDYRAIRVAVSGDVTIAGGSPCAAIGGIDPGRIEVLRLDTDGNEAWLFEGTSGVGNCARGLVHDSAGNVMVAGSVTDAGTGLDIVTIKLDGTTGVPLWQSTIDGGSSTTDVGLALALDGSGNPVVGGSFNVDPGKVSDLAVVKLDGTTGTELWRLSENGGGMQPESEFAVYPWSDNEAWALAVDAAGNVISAGTLNTAPDSASDFAVVKRNPDGSDFVQLCGNGVIEGTELCDDGNVVAGDGCSDICQTETGFLCLGEPSSCVMTVGVAPKKLLVVDKLAASGSAKTVFAAKDANVSKGAGTDPTAISASFTAAYANGAARGGFAVPAGAWVVNSAKVAKYVNKAAPAGPTQTKVALIRPGSTLSLTAKGIGDTPFDILTGGDPAGDVNTAYCVSNGGLTTCHCSVNQNCVFTSVAGGAGAKLKCKGGVADPTCTALLP